MLFQFDAVAQLRIEAVGADAVDAIDLVRPRAERDHHILRLHLPAFDREAPA